MTPATGSGTANPATALAFLALLAGVAGMAASPVFVRLADVGPFASAFWRVALALPVLWAWNRLEGRRAPAPLDRRAITAIVLAGLFFAGDLFFWHLAILNTTVANATFFATTAPVWVLLGSWLVLRDRVPRATLIGLLLAMAGGAALIGESLEIAPHRVRGDLYGLVTALFFSAYFLAIGRARKSAGTARITYLSTVVTALALGIIALALEDRLLPASPEGWLVLLALALISQVGGQGLLAYALGHLPAAFSALVILLEAIIAALLGWLILEEALSLLQVAGGTVILLGIWIARPRRRLPPLT